MTTTQTQTQTTRTKNLVVGDRIDAGDVESRDRGTVVAINKDDITVSWDSLVQTTQPRRALINVEVVGFRKIF